MIDISNTGKVKGDKFTITEEIVAGKEVTFKTKWRGKEWLFQGHIGKDKKTVHLTMLHSL